MVRRVSGLASLLLMLFGASLAVSNCSKTPSGPDTVVVVPQPLRATGQTNTLPPVFIDVTLRPGTTSGGQQPITGTFTATPVGGTSFSGTVEGNVAGTFDNNGNGGNFTGTVRTTLADGCAASRPYQGPLTRSSLAWTGQPPTNNCNGNSPLTFDVTLPVTVDPPEPQTPSVAFAVTSVSVSNGQQTGTVQITANTSWTAASNQSWLTIVGGAAGGSGTTTLTYSVEANSGSPRPGTITVAHGSTSATLTVNQAGGTAPTSSPTIATQPQNQTIVSGQTATLSVTATGTAPLSYQWYAGASPTTTNPVSGATGSSFTTPVLTSTTSYWVRVTNSVGNADSGTATVTVTTGPTAPTIATQPQSQTIGSGQTATLSVTATGTATLSYQWFAGTSPNTTNPVAGATASSFTTPALTSTTSYWVRVTNAIGSVDSTTATITVTATPPPTITVQPQSQTIASGQTVTLSVTATGTALSYQWFAGTSPNTANPIAGATASSFTTPALTATTSYWVRVTNTAGIANSTTATITVTPPVLAPAITVQPQSQTIVSGQTATLTVTATGTALSYQWFAGVSPSTANPIPGATASSFTTPALTATTSYWVRVTNTAGTANSTTATITVTGPAVACTSFTVTPSATTVASGGLITFDVRPLPTGCLWVAHQADGIPFDGAIDPQTPWTFNPLRVFAGNQILTARVFNNPGNQNPSQNPLTAGIDFKGSDATGTVLSLPLFHVTFTITR